MPFWFGPGVNRAVVVSVMIWTWPYNNISHHFDQKKFNKKNRVPSRVLTLKLSLISAFTQLFFFAEKHLLNFIRQKKTLLTKKTLKTFDT